MSVAADKRETSSLHQLLGIMISREPGSRPSLKNVLTSCIHLTHEDAAAEINELVSLVLGRHNDVREKHHYLLSVCSHFFTDVI